MRHRIHRHTSSRAAEGQDAQLGALVDYLQALPAESTELFSGSLELLVDRLEMDLALLTRVADLGYEVFWWAGKPGFVADDFLLDPVIALSERVIGGPRRTLVVRDLWLDPRCKNDPSLLDRGIRSYIGAALFEGGKVIGTLGVQSGTPREFRHAEVALVAAVANLLSKTLEIENLKNTLRLTREALELSSAVLEDSALTALRSGLPNRRYLEVWLKANLTLARRNSEPMALMLLQPQGAIPWQEAMKAVADALRGMDLLVDYGDGSYLVLLPGTGAGGVPILFDRILALCPAAVSAGATEWDPVRDDLGLRSVMKRLRRALEATKGQGLLWVKAEPLPSA